MSVEHGKSFFDDYDDEEGYNETEETDTKIISRKELIYFLYRNQYENGVGYTECRNTDFCSYVDFVCYLIDKKREEKESESEVM